MLIKKKPAKGDLLAIKLVNGEEIVGRIEDNPLGAGENDVTLKAPLGWMLTQQGVMPAPFMVTAEDKPTITYLGSAIIARTSPRKEIENAYIQITTGIAMPDTGGGVGVFTKG